jgi:micrococcal nuclease
MVARRWTGAISVLVLATACGSLGGSGVRVTDRPVPGDGETRSEAVVTRVVDGDTIHVDLDGRDTTIRIIGIDTPEREGPYTHEECFGQEASRYTEEALDGRDIELEFDVERTDRFDRTLAYVWLNDTLFDERILRDGYAVLLTVPPNVRYVDRFTDAQAAARQAGAGLWGACPGG